MILLALALLQGAAAISAIDTREPVAATLFGDADGDGLKDALLLLGRRVALHRQRADRTFPETADFSVKLPADAVAIDFVVLDPPASTKEKGRAVLLAAGPKGVSVRTLEREEGSFEPLALPQLPGSLLARAAGAPPIAMALAVDLDGDSLPELVIPRDDGAAVLRRAKEGWKLAGLAPAEIQAEVATGEDRPGDVVRQAFELPRIAVVDLRDAAGQPRRMLAVSRESDAWVWRLDSTGLRLVEHAHAAFRLDNEDRFRAVRGTRRNEEVNDRAVGLVPVDLNGDGIPDFISSRFRDGEVFVIVGREGEFVADSPDRTIGVDGWAVLAQAKDFDGDRRPDLVVPRLEKIGILAALRALLSRKVSFDIWIYVNDGSPQIFGDRPAWKRSFDFELVIGGEEGRFSATGRLLAAFADTQGRGRIDLVTRTADDKLGIFVGSREKIIEPDPALELPIPAVSAWSEVDLRAVDLDGDGRDDLVLTYGSNKKGSRNKIVLLLWRPRS